jgi:hypothetical protein
MLVVYSLKMLETLSDTTWYKNPKKQVQHGTASDTFKFKRIKFKFGCMGMAYV